MLDRLVTLAREAGELILQKNPFEDMREKEDGSPVTAADLAANDLIIKALKDIAPGYPVISEESALPPYDKRKDWPRYFLVDPLDGTRDYVAGSPDFTVNIALVERGRTRLAVICAPKHGSIYFAEKGRGSWKQPLAGGAPRRIYSSGAGPSSPLRVVESRNNPSPRLEQYLASYQVASRTKVGSSYKFCLVAEGAADLYARFTPTSEWDVAAGDCLFRNSVKTGHPESPFEFNKPELVCGAFVIGAVNEALA
jgi:3'(2'), 5'-bisphosphate nucleotidase